MEGTVRMSNVCKVMLARTMAAVTDITPTVTGQLCGGRIPSCKLESRAIFRQSQRTNCPKRGIFQILQT